MRTVFIICAILLAHYFEGYWINEQDRDPRYANRIISMNAAKASSVWRKLLILKGSKTRDIVFGAALVQFFGIIWAFIELLLYVICIACGFDNYKPLSLAVFFGSVVLLTVYSLEEAFRYKWKKYVKYNTDNQLCWIADIFEAFNIRIKFKCVITDKPICEAGARQICSIILCRSGKAIDNVLMSDNAKSVGEYAYAIHYGDNSSKYHWVVI